MNLLERILADTRALVSGRKKLTPIARLESLPSFSAPTLDFVEALREGDLSIIAEVKKASPTRGLLRGEFNPAWIARQYGHGGASAVSVLTEPLHFLGSLENLAAVRQASDLPLLRKDFVVDPYQLYEARAFGADAVLLIASALEPAELRDLHQTAGALGLGCLVEVHEIEELDKLDLDQVRVVGVNNRDLKTFTVDLARSTDVFQALPPTTVKVSESGMRDPADLAYVRRHGADAVLIGETFMRASEPGLKLRELIARSQALLESDGRLRLVG